tara:strand:- start:271 stop:432 length:162 start_codon:yes stop_codon:yes gene_type:complete
MNKILKNLIFCNEGVFCSQKKFVELAQVIGNDSSDPDLVSELTVLGLDIIEGF